MHNVSTVCIRTWREEGGGGVGGGWGLHAIDGLFPLGTLVEVRESREIKMIPLHWKASFLRLRGWIRDVDKLRGFPVVALQQRDTI